MYNPANVERTLIELRNAMSLLRDPDPSSINFAALELVLSHAMVDLSMSAEAVSDLAKKLDEVTKKDDQASN